MALEEDKLKIRQVLSATIASLCNNGLNFNLELRIEGLIGITLDKDCVFLVNINEVLPSRKKKVELQGKQPSGVNKPGDCQTKRKSVTETTSHIKKEPQSPRSGSNTAKDSHASESFQDQKFNVKEEPSKVVSERLETECLSMQQHGGGYAEVQKSVKTVQHPEGLVEQKQVEWKTYDADGRVLEHKKVEAVQTMAQPLPNTDSNAHYVSSDMNQHDYNAQFNNHQDYYYDQEFDNYDDIYQTNDPSYYEQQPEYDSSYDVQGHSFPSSTRGKKTAKRSGKRGSRGKASSRIDHNADQRQQASTSPSNGSSKASDRMRNNLKSRQQFHQPPSKKQCFQQQFQEHYPPSQPQTSFAPAKSPVKGRPGKDLLKRAMQMVTEGKVSAGTAINLFGIPKSTFYKELSNYKKTVEEYPDNGYNAEEWLENPGENAEYGYSGYEEYQ